MKIKAFIVSLFFVLSLAHLSCSPPPPIEKGIIVNGFPHPALHEALRRNDEEKLKELFSKKKRCSEEFEVRRRRYFAAMGKCLDVNLKSHDGSTPLFHVRSVDMAKLLVSQGADIFIRDKNGETPLHFAHSPEIAKFFLEKGLDIETRSEGGETPLYIAVVWGRIETARFLFRQGANPHAETDLGWTPLEKLQDNAGWFDFELNSLIREFKSYTAPKTKTPPAKDNEEEEQERQEQSASSLFPVEREMESLTRSRQGRGLWR